MRTIEFKLYPTPAQAGILTAWLRSCCWVYNQALEHRKKAYTRRGKATSQFKQAVMLTEWRSRIATLQSAPVEFERSALRRLDRGMQAFFRRVKSGEKPGFPRFKASVRYNSMESVNPGKYIQGEYCRIPNIGFVRFKGRKTSLPTMQKLLRIIRRGKEWYGHVVVDDVLPDRKMADHGPIGIDVGLTSFATLSNGDKIDNPRWARMAEKRLRLAHRHLSRCIRGSRNRRKAVHRVRRIYDRIRMQRRNFCHRLSRRLVDNHPIIAVEDLNVKGLAASRLSKSVMDAGWSIFLNQLACKAANAGRKVIRVDPQYTSQICPNCREVRPKKLKERLHRCRCGCVLDRDVAASRVILARAVGPSGSVTPSEDCTSATPAVAV